MAAIRPRSPSARTSASTTSAAAPTACRSRAWRPRMRRWITTRRRRAEMSAMETHEHAEHAEHAAHAHAPLISRITITIAVLAVAAAVTTSLEAVESSGAVIAANHAVLAQDKATDAWNFYQAKSIKKNLFQVAAATPGPSAADWARKAGEEGKDQG